MITSVTHAIHSSEPALRGKAPAMLLWQHSLQLSWSIHQRHLHVNCFMNPYNMHKHPACNIINKCVLSTILPYCHELFPASWHIIMGKLHKEPLLHFCERKGGLAHAVVECNIFVLCCCILNTTTPLFFLSRQPCQSLLCTFCSVRQVAELLMWSSASYKRTEMLSRCN